MMMKILHVIPSLDQESAARQVSLLARGLAKGKFEIHIGLLGAAGPEVATLREVGMTVHVLNWTRSFDPGPPWNLRRLVRSLQPEVIHAWGPGAARALALSGTSFSCPVVIGQPLPGGRRPVLGRVDRWLLGRAKRIVARGPDEAARCQKAGLKPAQITIIPPGVPPGPSEDIDDRHLGTTPRPILACAGPFPYPKGCTGALVTADILHYLFGDLQLWLLGDDSDRSRLENVVQRLSFPPIILFRDRTTFSQETLGRADVVWALGGDTSIILEAMALGKPVIAANGPGLAEIVVDGVTGFLVPPEDKVTLARRTRWLFENPTQARQFGAAARQRALDLYQADRWLESWSGLYEELAA